MTPAEKIAGLRDRANASPHIYDPCPKHPEYFGSQHYKTPMDERPCSCRGDYMAKLLALAEAVPARLNMGHNDSCWRGQEGGLCTCGHDALAAAWAALGDG